jgi:RNA polymerase sigma-70 factor (ECF subfamily)
MEKFRPILPAEGPPVSTYRRPETAEAQQWTELDNRFRGALQAYFLRRVGDRCEAEDLTQEVFARLSRQSQQPEAMQAYLFVTAANLLKDRARSRATRHANAHQSLETVLPKPDFPGNLVEDRDPERVLAGKDTLRELIAGLDALSERTRDIFILARVEHMSQNDIAKLFGISVSAVEKHIVKALNHLGARLARR